ncbi:ABC-2 type transport system permease protein [Marinimicrobium koreense]|uniref:Transport permease protein n=1 Tax=Marinimicrobium koreense TaxID=306545 RepID=A0A3N1P400_9GAMM|nr:ABC transporter permease [Marinimicrobium koreense]ROQ21887.1 ABC-2 type transport system permease protein [Marinimicrobium koreense]
MSGSSSARALIRGIRVLDRPAPAGPIACTIAFGWRALLKIKYVPEQMFDVLVTPIMFTVMFTYLFGGALAGSTGDYLQYLLPGILAQTVVFTSIYTGVTLNGDLSKGVYDRFKSLPIWAPAPLVGAMLGDILRYTGASLIVVLIGLLLGYRPEQGIVGVLLSLVLLNIFGFGLGWIFTVLGLLLRTPGAVMTLSWLVLMPLTFVSNIYVDPATMPELLQTLVALNPVSHLVSAMRGAMVGELVAFSLGIALLTPALLTLTFGPLAMRLYHRKH